MSNFFRPALFIDTNAIRTFMSAATGRAAQFEFLDKIFANRNFVLPDDLRLEFEANGPNSTGARGSCEWFLCVAQERFIPTS